MNSLYMTKETNELLERGSEKNMDWTPTCIITTVYNNTVHIIMTLR